MQPPSLPVPTTEWLDLSRQQRNLLLMRPLFQLDVNKHRLGNDPSIFENVDTTYLMLSALDGMMDGLMTGQGLTEMQVVERMMAGIQAMPGSLTPEQRRTVAEAVFAAITNKKNGYKPFEFRYFDAPSGTWHPVRFRLVAFEQDMHDDYHYRPTREGYQVYLGMLDLDLEDAQEMDEKMLQRLIDRGRFDSALDVARQSRTHTLEYREMLRQRLTNALRAPGTVSWTGDLGPKVQEATRFVRERREQAEVSWDLVNDQLRSIEDEAVRHNLVRLRESLDQAADVRLRLVHELLKAPEEFSRAQASVFRARRPSGLPNLENDLLPRLLALPLADLAAGADNVLASLFPPEPVKLFDLKASFDQYVDRRTRPVPLEAPVIAMAPIAAPVENFPRELVAQVMAWIGQRFAEGMPIDTQALLDRASADGMDTLTQRCVAMTLLRCFAGAPPAGQQQPESPFPTVSAIPAAGPWFDHPVATGTNLTFTPQASARPSLSKETSV